MTGFLRRAQSHGSTPYSALVVLVTGEVDRSIRTAVEELLEQHGFSSAEVFLGSAQQVQELCAEAEERFDVLITVGGLRTGAEADLADLVRAELDVELPGLAELIRRTQYESGYPMCVFENSACGRIDATVVFMLPDDLAAVTTSLETVMPLISEMLTAPREEESAELDPGFFVQPPDAGKVRPLPKAAPRPDATILQMPRPTDAPDDTSV